LKALLGGLNKKKKKEENRRTSAFNCMLFKKKEFLVRIGADAMQIAWQTSRNKHYAAFGLLFQINCVGPNKFSLHNLNNNCALAKESLSTDNKKKRGGVAAIHQTSKI